MKIRFILLLVIISLAACGPSGSDRVPVAELPDPAIYGLRSSDLPEVGLPWQQSYNLTTSEQDYKWAYLAYQAYQPGGQGGELESAFAVNNDVILYEMDMRREELPQPPQAMGNIQNITWQSAKPLHKLGDKSALWKTTLGEMFTPVWWLEFYQGHAYVRISLLGFPDQIAPSYLYGMADIVVERLPRSVDTLRSDAATVISTIPIATLSPIPQASLTPSTPGVTISPTTGIPGVSLPILGYIAPHGDTGMVSFFDDTGNQLVDGIFGSDDILADLGSGTAYEWVGWTDLTEPVTLTFSLQGDATIAAVEIGLNHREGLAVFVPRQVTINGQSFDLPAEAVPNNQRKDLTFTGPFHGPTVNIVLYHRGRGWILIDEVRFIPGS